MSNELEQRLEVAFRGLPKPTRDASARARAGALAVLAPERRRSRFGLAIAVAAVAFTLGAGAAALAATGNLHVKLGSPTKHERPIPARLSVPPGTHGIAVVAGGRLWLATLGGLRIEGLPVSAAELSPRALYAVVGIGSSLVALAPGGRRAWVHPTSGRVLRAAWSPDGLKIAYLVEHPGGDELHMVEGDGSPDRLLARGVRPVRPSWRADSLAVAYVDGRGRAASFDLRTGTPRTFDTRRCGGGAREVVYAPTAPALAVYSARGVAVVDRWSRPARCRPVSPSGSRVAGGWLAGGQLVTGGLFGRMRVTGFAVGPAGSAVAVAVPRRAGGVSIGIVREPRIGGTPQPSWLVRLRARPTGVSISWR
ncbi:MAG TPA: hypothetical protein VF063_09900 [Gaiellaceae bacterium]